MELILRELGDLSEPRDLILTIPRAGKDAKRKGGNATGVQAARTAAGRSSHAGASNRLPGKGLHTEREADMRTQPLPAATHTDSAEVRAVKPGDGGTPEARRVHVDEPSPSSSRALPSASPSSSHGVAPPAVGAQAEPGSDRDKTAPPSAEAQTEPSWRDRYREAWGRLKRQSALSPILNLSERRAEAAAARELRRSTAISRPDRPMRGTLWREHVEEEYDDSGFGGARQQMERFAEQSLEIFKINKPCELHIRVRSLFFFLSFLGGRGGCGCCWRGDRARGLGEG